MIRRGFLKSIAGSVAALPMFSWLPEPKPELIGFILVGKSYKFRGLTLNKGKYIEYSNGDIIRLTEGEEKGMCYCNVKNTKQAFRKFYIKDRVMK